MEHVGEYDRAFWGKARPFEQNTLFSALNLPLDEEKLRYYSLLSELCP